MNNANARVQLCFTFYPKFIKTRLPLPEDRYFPLMIVPLNASRSLLTISLIDPLDNPTNRSLGELLRLVLTCNNFEFDNKHFLQVGGTAMGTKLAPSYANIFLGEFERLHVYPYHLQPSLWKRFIDDIFFNWPHATEELKRFVEFLNNRHQTIKFTLEHSYTLMWTFWMLRYF